MPGARAPVLSVQIPKRSVQQDPDEALLQHDATVDPQASSHSLPVIAAVCSINAAMSISLIAFNKYLMHKGRFPYPVPLVTGHCAMSTALIFGMWLMHRCFGSSQSGFFAALPGALNNGRALKRRIIIISLFYALQLVVTNAAYMFSDMVFIQMMKEVNIALVYLASFVVALEVFCVQRCKALFLIMFATMLTIKGEMNFTWRGFCVQGAGQVFEVGRIVLQALMLCGSAKLDVFTYVLFVAPVSAAMLGGFLLADASLAHPLAFISVPTWSIVLEWWPVLVLNAVLAFALTMTTALTVKYASAMGLILTGVIKDTCIILFGAYFFREEVTLVQGIGFSLQMLGIMVYSAVKLHPDKFEDGIISGITTFSSPKVSLPSTSTKRYGAVPLNA